MVVQSVSRIAPLLRSVSEGSDIPLASMIQSKIGDMKPVETKDAIYLDDPLPKHTAAGPVRLTLVN